jgi:Mycothiol maleylpyruvate isomerase N-terminal domain
MINGDDVLAVAAASSGLLEPAVGADWAAAVPGLDFTVSSVVAHAANCVLWYAVDLWAGPADDAAFELKVRADAASAAILVSLRSAALVCAASVNAAPAGIRGFHPAGAADASGFAAMACDEVLVHTDDAARGLGLRFAPDPGLARRVLARLFPWHDPGGDPWQTLLWANGRIDLPGRPDQTGWRWHCAPLADWDGLPPGRPAGRSS